MAAITAVAVALEANFKFESVTRGIADLLQKGVNIVGMEGTYPAELETLLLRKTSVPFPVKIEIVGGSVRSHDPYWLRQKVNEIQRLRFTPTNRRIAVRGDVAQKDTFVAVAGLSCEARAFCSPPRCPNTLNEVPVVKTHLAAFAVARFRTSAYKRMRC